jgi:hypothetical protein
MIMISDTALGSPQMIPVTGFGSTGSAVSISSIQQTMNFNTQMVGTTSSQQTLLVRNSGVAPLNVSGLSTSDDFQATADPRIREMSE